MGIRIWLDDKRSPPDGHVSCRWPEEVIALLKKGDVDSISLDHDLGEDSGYENPRTGEAVLKWIEEQVATTDYIPPKSIRIHTQNPVAKDRMMKIRWRIGQFLQERKNAI